MGKIEDKIKQDLMGEIFADSFKIYEFIDTRFKLSEEERTLIIAKINGLNNDLTNILKEIKLS
ncbi:MAG: hypothetical protein RBT59_08435 [Arcobacteraceae bacterium]|jgi:hypothetical protein|nr:hypothetical protein [Arcobacteraceae bacterium]